MLDPASGQGCIFWTSGIFAGSTSVEVSQLNAEQQEAVGQALLWLQSRLPQQAVSTDRVILVRQTPGESYEAHATVRDADHALANLQFPSTPAEAPLLDALWGQLGTFLP